MTARGPNGGRVTRAPFGTLPDGRQVDVFTIEGRRGYELRVMSYGAAVLSLRTPDRDGRLDDIVLGFDELTGYLGDSPYFGAVVGRYGNRIARGRFMLDGIAYQLTVNDPPNHLHGGGRGFDKLLWAAEPLAEADNGVGVRFRLTSPDGEEGYPGTLVARVGYTLTDRDELVVDYQATADRATPVNLTQHSYFNLASGGDVLGHELMIAADAYTPTDARLIPTGRLAPVGGTAFDFRLPTAIGARIEAADAQLRNGGGYDHNFVLRPRGEGVLAHAARLTEPTTGRTLDVHTTEPGLQLYSGNFLDGTLRGKSGRVYGHRSGVCLETQHFPDSPNEPRFPSTILRPGEEYRSRTVFTFGVQR